MATGTFPGFSPSLFQFLKQLARNNNREWFNKNKSRYETDVLQPTLQFVEAFAPRLKKISPFVLAVPKKVGGSVMRVYRDTRFSKDKTPYKTNVGIHFRHQLGKDVHTPGFYVHLQPGECFLGVGIWHPDNPTLAKIRTAIVEDETGWTRARDNSKFRKIFRLAGDELKKPPRGFDPQHPLIDDLRRKDFVADQFFPDADASNPKFIGRVADAFAASKPLMRFLCQAIGVPF